LLWHTLPIITAFFPLAPACLEICLTLWVIMIAARVLLSVLIHLGPVARDLSETLVSVEVLWEIHVFVRWILTIEI
jgi:hypothetical protein